MHSGYTFRTRAILDHQRALGWETEHLTGPKHTAAVSGPSEEVDGLTFHRAPARGGLLERLPVLKQYAVIRTLVARLTGLVKDIAPDVLHAHSPALNGKAALTVGRAQGIPVLYEVRAFWEDAAVDHGTSTEGGLRYRLTRRLETGVLKAADAVTTICEGLRRDIVARGISEDKVTVIPNAVDISRFSIPAGRDAELEASLGLAGQSVLGFIGSFYAYEGLALLLDALPRILAVRPETIVLLVGGGNEAEALKAQAARLGVAERVRFTGRVPNAEVARYYSLCDAMVYPRLSMRLTELVTPLKPLEAMAQGRLVVASDVGGHQELIDPGATGRLFPAGDAEALATAVLTLLADEASWPAIRAAGRKFVEEERNWARSVARYAAVFDRILKRA